MNSDTIFYDSETLQAAISRALQDRKALLCFVTNEGAESVAWESALLHQDIRAPLQQDLVALRLTAGSEQAGYLNAFCPIHHVPAVIVIHNAQVTANLQHDDKTTLSSLQQWLDARYVQTDNHPAAEDATEDGTSKDYIDLPDTQPGRMRLPNNAYDEFKKVTRQHIEAQMKGKRLLYEQLLLLESLNIESVTAETKRIKAQVATITNPQLSLETIDKLLNTPASKLRSRSAGSTGPDISLSSNSGPSRSIRPAQARASTESTSRTQTSQADTYRDEQRHLEEQRRAERERIKNQIAEDRRTRREAEAALAREQQQSKLTELRKNNSTTSDPKATDIRIQVRKFDGSTVRTSFACDATIAGDVRDWIDRTSESVVPYDLKLILSPAPNRTIEAAEEGEALGDIDGIKNSATLVMVPVKTYVNSYTNNGGTGILSTIATAPVSLVSGLLGGAYNLASTSLAGFWSSQRPVVGDPAQRQTNQTAETGHREQGQTRVRTMADHNQDHNHRAGQNESGYQRYYTGGGQNVIEPKKKDDDNQS